MNEKGMSLIEIIVCLSIMSIISTLVFQFVIVGINTSTNAAKDANIQKEAQTSVNQLKDWIMETNQGIRCYDGTADYDKVVAIYQHENTMDGAQDFVQLLYYRQEERTIYYNRVVIGEKFNGLEMDIAKEGNRILSEKMRKDYVFSRYVKDFAIDTSRVSEQKVTIQLTYEDRGKNYQVENVVKMRNTPKEDPAEFGK